MQAGDRSDGGGRDEQTHIINNTIRKTKKGALRLVDKNNPWFEELLVKTKEAYFKDEKGGSFNCTIRL